jgi:hypothetical protein
MHSQIQKTALFVSNITIRGSQAKKLKNIPYKSNLLNKIAENITILKNI